MINLYSILYAIQKNSSNHCEIDNKLCVMKDPDWDTFFKTVDKSSLQSLTLQGNYSEFPWPMYPINYLSDKGAEYLATFLKENASLKTLKVNQHNLSSKGAESIASALKEKAILQSLNLAFNDIGEKGAKSIASALIKNTTLRTLNLKNNNIGEKGAKSIASALNQNIGLHTLLLNGNKIGKGATALALALSNSALHTLGLGGNRLSLDDIISLCNVLKQGNALRSLDLSWNDIGEKAAEQLSFALKQRTCPLTSLDLSNTTFGKEKFRTDVNLPSLNFYNNDTGKGIEFLAEALDTNVNLLFLNLECNNLGVTGAKLLAKALLKNTTLLTLNLDCNYIGEKGTAHLANALLKNGTLQNLSLNRNYIGDKGALLLVPVLMANRILTLSLDSNCIGAEGAKFLACAFCYNTSLVSFSLADNKIGDEGAKFLAYAFDINKNSSLKSLNLGSNGIENEGIAYLAYALQKCYNLYSFCLGANFTVSDQIANYLISLLMTNKSLRKLNVHNTKISYRPLAAINQILAQNNIDFRMCFKPLIISLPKDLVNLVLGYFEPFTDEDKEAEEKAFFEQLYDSNTNNNNNNTNNKNTSANSSNRSSSSIKTNYSNSNSAPLLFSQPITNNTQPSHETNKKPLKIKS